MGTSATARGDPGGVVELCPRCTSTVADDASTCPSCGATIWQPGSLARQVAVTPAPVEFVPPIPMATPPPLPSVTLPPQRVATRDAVSEATAQPAAVPHEVAPPPAPIRSETVIPVTPPVPHKTNRWLIPVGTIVPLLTVVVLLVALPAHGAKPEQLPVVATDLDAQLNLRALAAAEETNLTATRTYTTDSTALDAAGYRPAPGKPVTISAGVSDAGYCLIATAGGAAPWFLYDSMQGGLVSSDFTAEYLAEQACADTAIKSYLPIR
jgi:hypothetical protein